ncbi:hypothetical protein EON63_13170 [archaeon]|nr:MAG: hypothetical protein EON63_13170 [archaeon]
MAWRRNPQGRFQLAIGSFIEEYINQFQIVQLDRTANSNTGSFKSLCQFDHPYPATKVQFAPSKHVTSGGTDLIATTGDYLRLWNLGEDNQVTMHKLMNNNKNSGKFLGCVFRDHLYLLHTKYHTPFSYTVLKWSISYTSHITPFICYTPHITYDFITHHTPFNPSHITYHTPDYCAPLTSFDWNEADTSLLGVSSIDTTCTMWDLTTQTPKTQLIAHDKDVSYTAIGEWCVVYALVELCLDNSFCCMLNGGHLSLSYIYRTHAGFRHCLRQWQGYLRHCRRRWQSAYV